MHSHAFSCNLVTSIFEGKSEFRISHQEMIKGEFDSLLSFIVIFIVVAVAVVEVLLVVLVVVVAVAAVLIVVVVVVVD